MTTQDAGGGENNGASGDDTACHAWADRAEELGTWAWQRCVNRTDVWGGYNPLAHRGKKYLDRNGGEKKLGSTTTRPRPSRRGKDFLTPGDLTRHFRATCPEHVVGLHTTSPHDASLWGAVEIDWHGPGGNDPDSNLRAALAWHGALAAEGFHPLLTDSNGKGGYHLRVLLDAPAATPLVFYYLKALVADHLRYGLAKPPETFPKQASLKTPFGNWLRLPGRHHTRAHWARIWDGCGWLAGATAVDFLLSCTGDPKHLIPLDAEARWRVAAFMAKLPNPGEAQGRDDVAYRFAAFLVRDMALGDPVALDWLARWDAGNTPPKGRVRLWEILANAHAYGQNPYGCGASDGNGAGDATDGWEPPLSLNTLPAADEFPTEVFPASLELFAREAAEAVGCPVDYFGLPMLAIAGGAIGASKALAVKKGYVQRGLLYGAIVGPPGDAKSPALSMVAGPLHDAQHRAWELYKQEKLVHESDCAKAKQDGKEKPAPPLLRRVHTDDATTESLGPILQRNPRGVSMIKDELAAWVTAANQYKGGRGSDRQFWLSNWAGVPACIDRKGVQEPLIIPYPFVCVLGGIQPDVLEVLADPRGRADGSVDRILFAYPDARRAAEWTWEEVADDVIAPWRETVQALLDLNMEPGAHGLRPHTHQVKEALPFKKTGSPSTIAG